MMKVYKIFCAMALVAALNCGAQKIDPMSQAVLSGYTEILDKNPKDYETLYERAVQYQQLGMDDEAMADVKAALSYTPEKNTDLREREYSLLSSVAHSLGDYELALTSIQNALNLNPANYVNVYKKGHILLSLDRPEDAYRTFSSMQSLRSRSQEAYYGMAIACVKQGKYSEAESLMKEIESANSTSPTTFVRLGKLYEDMNRPHEAATNYLIAITLEDNGKSGIRELSDLAETNYTAVSSALDMAAEKSVENRPMMLYLKGIFARNAGKYQEVEEAMSKLIKGGKGVTPGTYSSLAQARLALNELPEAMEAVNSALNLQPSASNYNLKAQIELAMGNTFGATNDANKAIETDPDFINGYITAAESAIASGNATQAIEFLNRAIMTEPDNTRALLIRAYVNSEMNNNAKASVADLNRILLETPESIEEIAIQAIARAKSGKKIDADEQMKAVGNNAPTPDDLYWGAVYCAQTGALEQAKALIDRAIYEGFMNKHLLLTSKTPWLNLSPIAHLLK